MVLFIRSFNNWASNFFEHDGCARSVILILLITTISCISYTWGYFEGVRNTNIVTHTKPPIYNGTITNSKLSSELNTTTITKPSNSVVEGKKGQARKMLL